jgi:hypothetical protein
LYLKGLNKIAAVMKEKLSEKIFSVSIALFMFILLISCSEPGKTDVSALSFPAQPDPRGYVCYRTSSPVKTDGIPDEKAWSEVPWTDYFVDIEGSSKPVPKLKTRAKMLWDDSNLYIAAELEEPHVWATLRQRDTVIFFDNDFEVFIDPDGDTQGYCELEVNALATAWDLLLLKAYRDGGPPVTGWDIAGLQVGTHVDGTINNPADIDRGWTVEIKIPLAPLKECSGLAGMPVAGDRWRIDFSRVEWRTLIENGSYKKEINPATGNPFPEYNWVWSPQGRINMHMPEMWGFVQFSSIEAGQGTEAFIPDPDLNMKWALRMIYYAEDKYYIENNIYASTLKDLGLKQSDFPKDLPAPVIESTRSAFEAYFPSAQGTKTWTIYQDSRIIKK